MFCTSSYVLAGEDVPQWYTKMEDFVINNVKTIITPSQAECMRLHEDYNCNLNKIKVVPRGINPSFSPAEKHEFSQTFKLVYIASIKPQKNILDAVKLIQQLKGRGKPYELHLVCTLQDRSIYDEIQAYISAYNLKDNVVFHIGLSQSEVASLLKQMDFNISVSNWETFGRGIYEGISSGLPTFVFERLEAVRELCEGNAGVFFCKDLNDMANKIEAATISDEEYNHARSQLVSVAEKVSYKTEQMRLLEIIIK